ncbi:MAG TPA: DEAD/DEAH box helicase family protein, partial [Pyrinomonadaceae bacterium]|nr:DEAD/DEAH box helicase family protein [Pyrinomonadaceae bacterium]
MSVSAQIEDSTPKFVHVALPVHLRKLFTYRLPGSMQTVARVGSRVVVRLGNKPMTGYIVALLPRLRDGTSLVESELKEVEELLDVEASLTSDVVELTRWVADYYAAPLGEVMRAALPAGINTSIMQVVSITEHGRNAVSEPSASADGFDLTATKTRALQILADEGEAEVNAFSMRMGSARIPKWLRELETDGLIERAYRTRTTATRAKRQRLIKLARLDDSEKRTDAQQRAIAILAAKNGPMTPRDLINAADISPSVIATLKKKGVVEEFAEDMRRDPLARAELRKTEDLTLTSAQAAALDVIESSITESTFSPFLLHGVTGSGKTEIYIRAMRTSLNSGRGAMMLVPEISLTPILSRRLRAHFGDQIAIFHSSL